MRICLNTYDSTSGHIYLWIVDMLNVRAYWRDNDTICKCNMHSTSSSPVSSFKICLYIYSIDIETDFILYL